MVWTCPKNGRREIAKIRYEMASTKDEENGVDLNLPGQKGLED